MPFSCLPFFACNRQVDLLDRRQCNLQSVPHDIDRNARTLEEMYLDCNHIKDLEKPLFRCRKLKILSLSENEIIRLPSDIAHLTCLEELSLKGNDISDLPEEIKNCTQLKILDLSSNPITRLPSTITQLTSMTSLGLNDISLTQMPHDIGQLQNLRSLEVRENLLRTLPSSISQLNQLQRLDLGHNELDDLPKEIGMLENLEELYVDQNDLETLPDSIVQCRSLEQLDVSENKLMVLPDEIGDLEKLGDLTVAHNCLQVLPSSLGRLKKLIILKADRNAITQLTPAIGSCHALTEIYLTENFLTEIPSSLGNLKCLRMLNLDKNQLKELPPTIGGCTSLSVLSLRDNLLEQLPLEIGRLENLRVLDVCNNRLNYLPFTINVLFKLRALWLSENQSQAMLKLQTEQDPRTGIKVLTCYLLPQSSLQPVEQTPPNRSFIGGPKVHFGSDLEETHEEDEGEVGQFSRHDTPHPKPHTHAPKFKKQSIDGHIIHHDDEASKEYTITLKLPIKVIKHKHSTKPPVLTLNSGRKRSGDENSRAVSPSASATTAATTSNTTTNNNTHIASLRSALKHPPVLPNLANFEQSVEHIMNQRQNLSPGVEILNMKIHRDSNGGLGLSIAGGLESTPYKDDDNGLFVSKLAEGGPAMIAGLRVGDKLLRVNKTDVVNVRHQVAVTSMQDARDIVELTILRDLRGTPSVSHNASSGYATSPNQSMDNSFVSETIEPSSSMSNEVISTTIRRDVNGSPGFSVASGTGDAIVISSIAPGGAAEKDGKLRIGDRVLSVNGTNVKSARHDQAVALLTGHSGSDIYLVVQRDRGRQNLTVAPSSSSLSSTKTHTVAIERIPQPKKYGFGDSSWDGKTEEVELIRENNSLGLSIVGGSDHSSHPFGINSPGVFISKITANSPASQSQKLRIGDRILSVNNVNIRTAKHQAAVEALKQSDRTVRLIVIHEPQPPGLREVIIKRNAGEALGLNIFGGIGSPPANPLDKTDEGIFIERVERNGAASASSLTVGTRILEVNDESLLGCSQEEAARILRQSGTNVRLLVCDAFCTPCTAASAHVSQIGERQAAAYNSVSIADAQKSLNTTSSLSFKPSSSITSPPEITRTAGSVANDNTLSTSPLPPASVFPTAFNGIPNVSKICSSASSLPQTLSSFSSANTTTFSASIPRPVPPPIAPKPRIVSNQSSSATTASSTCWMSNVNPERLAFTSKLEKFEREIEIKRPNTNPTTRSTFPPAKKPLLNEDEVRKMKEEESKKVASGSLQMSVGLENDELDCSFEHILNNSAVPPRTMPTVIRTKKAENRMAACSSAISGGEPLNSVERRALEYQKRHEWRQARLKSLEADSKAAEEVMQQVEQINSRLANITEEQSNSPLPVNERILQNETSFEHNEYIDPVTGASTVSLVESSITQREVNF
ncbi:unnamed protein product [Thelazia callipaeda]|uniref:Protein lap1 n=1 Tax=Thelazia callipaeda TaxID=103827 RepID=A0A158RBN7_THECL|nr:unnamed protein product [Thelazia callipaeda]